MSQTEHEPFEPLEWQQEFIDCTDPVVLLSGTTGGGKSRAGYEKIHALAMTYPRTTIVACRKEKNDAMKSIKVNLDKNIIGPDPRVRWDSVYEAFEYSNGSFIFIYGLKDEAAREGLRSIGPYGKVDFFLLEEAIEFEEEDYNEVIGRVRGTSAGWTQIILMTNPGPMLHWINRRLIIGGEATVFLSNAKDNVHNPRSYLAALTRMTGIQKSRLVDGLWIDGDGRIIDTWLDDYNPVTGTFTGNVRPLTYVHGGGPLALTIDDGYAGIYDEKVGMFTARSHPRAILVAQLRPNQQFAVLMEDYRVRTKADKHINDVLEKIESLGWRRPRTAFYDKASASLKGALEETGFTSIYPSAVSVQESLKELIYAVGPDENHVREFVVDPSCRIFRMEMSSYAHDSQGGIIKQHDHGPDAARGMVWAVKRGGATPVSMASSEDIDIEEIRRQVAEAMESAYSDVAERRKAVPVTR